MMKSQKSKFKSQKFFLPLVLFAFYVLHTTYYIPTAIAVGSSTPSAELRQKLKALQEEIASKAAKLKTEVSKKLQNKAYIGFVKSVSKDTLTLALNTSTEMVTINDYTQYQNVIKDTGKTKLSFKDIEADDYIVALGDVDDNQLLIAKKIIRLNPPKEEKREIIFGEIISLGDDILTLQTKQGQNISISINQNTTFESKGKEVDFGDLKINRSIIVGGIASKNVTIKADFVYILPTGSVFKPKVATSSAKPVTTQNATPSAALKLKTKL